MPKDIVLIGSGGHAKSVSSVATSCGFNVIAYVDDDKAGEYIFEIPVISSSECEQNYSSNDFAIAIGDNAIREHVAKEYKAKFPNAKFPYLIHKSCIIDPHCKIMEGSVLMPLSNIGPGTNIGCFCIVNTHSSVDHDCNINDYASLAPGVVLGGLVTIGLRSAISIGCTVKHNLTIGHDVVIGANSYVNKIIKDNTVAYGTPCKKVSERKKFDPYLD